MEEFTWDMDGLMWRKRIERVQALLFLTLALRVHSSRMMRLVWHWGDEDRGFYEARHWEWQLQGHWSYNH